MSIDRWMDKAAVVHIHNGILLRHKNKCIWVSFKEVDELTAYYTEWSKSKGEIKIYTDRYIWNLEWRSWWIYLQGSNGETDWENRLLDVGQGEEGEDMYAESNVETYITICKTDSQWESAMWLRELKQGLGSNLEGWAGGEVQQGGNMCMPMADSCWYLAENNKIL